MDQTARIVIVDDAVFMRERIREILESAGHQVVAEGQNGREAVELYENEGPDLMTLDLVMPEVGGIDALREIRIRHPDARVIVCSSLSDQDAIIQAVGLGARDYVLKPIDPERLLEAVAKALKGRG